MLQGKIDVPFLIVKLPMLSGAIKNTFAGLQSRNTSVRTITNALNDSNLFKGMFSEVNKLLFSVFYLNLSKEHNNDSSMPQQLIPTHSTFTSKKLIH